jgi:hypothetical protein
MVIESMKDKPIISVNEARKLLGKDARELSDQEIIELITLLTETAQYFLSNNISNNQLTD